MVGSFHILIFGDLLENLFFRHALQLPLPEIAINGLPRTELSRKKSPLAVCLVDAVEDSVHDVTKRMFSCSFLRIDDFFNNLPPFISEVSWITGIHNVIDWLPLSYE